MALGSAGWTARATTDFPAFFLPQRVSEAESPPALGGRVRYLVLPKFHLEVRQPPAQGMEWNAEVHLRIQIVWLIVPHSYVARPAQGSQIGRAHV